MFISSSHFSFYYYTQNIPKGFLYNMESNGPYLVILVHVMLTEGLNLELLF